MEKKQFLALFFLLKMAPISEDQIYVLKVTTISYCLKKIELLQDSTLYKLS